MKTASRVLVAVLLLGLGVAGSACRSPEERVRVVLVTLDTLRYDSLAGAEGRPSTMPRLQRWAAGAADFTHFFSSTASTQPSHASMFTGLHPWEHGITKNGLRLDDALITVAERLRDAGFATEAVVASFPLARRFGFAQGFDHYDDRFVLGRLAQGQWYRDAQRYTGAESADDESAPEPEPEDPFYSLGGEIVERSLARLDAASARRQLFWFHLFDPHDPYGDAAGGEMLRWPQILQRVRRGEDPWPEVERARRLYDADVTALDEALARLLARLEADAAEIATHVVVVADHGESFGEDQSLAHGRRLIPSQIRVPCLIRSPLVEPGRRDDVAGSIDIATTLLRLAGVEGSLGKARPAPSRDLTQPGRPGARAYGMRRTFDEPYEDLRLDGSLHVLSGLLFYMADPRGRLHRGNGSGLETSEPSETEPLLRLFTSFEAALARQRVEDSKDLEIDQKLRALGYVG